jgi:hypothetical protein
MHKLLLCERAISETIIDQRQAIYKIAGSPPRACRRCKRFSIIRYSNFECSNIVLFERLVPLVRVHELICCLPDSISTQLFIVHHWYPDVNINPVQQSAFDVLSQARVHKNMASWHRHNSHTDRRVDNNPNYLEISKEWSRPRVRLKDNRETRLN